MVVAFAVTTFVCLGLVWWRCREWLVVGLGLIVCCLSAFGLFRRCVVCFGVL